MSRLLLPLLALILLVTKALGQPGELDMSFGNQGKVLLSETSDARSVVALRNGKLLLGGSFRTDESPIVDKAAVFSFSTDGNIDVGFGNNGTMLLSVPGWVTSLFELDDGRVLAVVDHSDYFQGAGVVRLNADGSLDSTFGVAGSSPFVPVIEPRSIAVQKDGCIVIAGYFWNSTNSDAALARYLPGGTLDTSFGNQGLLTIHFGDSDDYATDVVVQPDGKLVMVAYTWIGTGWDFAVARFTTGGLLDTSFGGDGKVITDFQQGSDLATGVLLLPDGKIIVGGGSAPPGGISEAALVRYLPDGGLDSAFGIGGKMRLVVANGSNLVRDVALQKNGRIIVAGEVYYGLGMHLAQLFAARFNADGSVDGTFGNSGWIVAQAGGSSYAADSMALQSDGRIVMAGYSAVPFPVSSALTVMRFDGDPTPPAVSVQSVTLPDETDITVNGLVNPNGTASTAQFEYGETTAYGNAIPVTLSPVDGRVTQAVSVTIHGLSPGTTYHYRLTAVNSVGTSPTSDSIFGTLISHASWRQQFFGINTNSGEAADGVDFDRDGLSNLIEWACRCDPTVGSTLPVTTTLSGGEIRFLYRRSVSALNAGMIFEVEWNDVLGGTGWSTQGVRQTVLSTDGATQTVRALVSAGSGGRRFVRLKVTSGP